MFNLLLPMPRWIVSQIGAREHYAAARCLAARGRLRLLCTDFWAGGRAWYRRGPKAVRSLAERFHPDLAGAPVASFNLPTIVEEIQARLRPRRTLEWNFTRHAVTGAAYCRRVNRALRSMELDPAADVFFGYDTGCLETLHLLRERGVPSIVDQIDPARVEERIVFEETRRWPDWQRFPGRIPEAYFDRLSQEWDLATRVLVNSPWSRDALIEQGVPADKIVVVPLAYEPPEWKGQARDARGGRGRPLEVLWLGTVNLRKGIPYLMEAARRLPAGRVTVTVAGPMLISDAAATTAPDNLRFIGRVGREQASALYAAADAFVLPTLSDGFAITQLEAMAHGLPVIATPNCGQVVTHGHDGLIVPPRNPDALAAAIERLDDDRGLLAAMSANALATSRRFTLAAFGDRLEAAAEQARPGVAP